MVWKIIFTILIIGIYIHFIMQHLHYGKEISENETLSKNAHRYIDILEIFVIGVLLLILGNIWHSDSYTLSEDEHSDLLSKVEFIQDELGYDYKSLYDTLSCYFEDVDISFEDAKEAYRELKPILQYTAESLDEIHSILSKD